ncbi:MAG: DUF3566 domain-containing protein [Acidimicrobiales bacterium]
MATTGSGTRTRGRTRSKPATRVVRRRVRRVQARSIILLSLLFYLGLLVVALVAGTVIWEVAVAAGAIGHLQHLAISLGFTKLTHLGSRLFHFGVYVGLVLVGIGTVVNIILVVVYNLVSDLVGGVSILVVEEDRRRRPRS